MDNGETGVLHFVLLRNCKETNSSFEMVSKGAGVRVQGAGNSKPAP